MRLIKKSILYTVIIIVLGILITLGLEAYIKQDTSSRIYTEIRNVPNTKTAIVLGASVYSSGKLSPILKDRVDSTIDLFKNQKVNQILISGDHGSDDYNEVDAIANYLINHGIPKNNLILDHAGFNTYDSMYRASKVFQIEDAIVVTQDFHLPRAMFIAKHLGLDYYGYQAKERAFRIETKIMKREKLANFKALFEVVFKTTPSLSKKKV
ncbi:SanA/YdcF family protein [Zunongwangia sp. HGR-M22]|uniref:SanA/YdcF family protein n=1 Tax=Zunongwangia sp. HGR-M22 TaxID=3015168 RepID=UPI0022DCF188|nr:ElyC/SanA/YdcF family protein [Zunongwangia sp. HGR-M22]WBL26822.1 YdcF family protein [Zunongwangia sp. HGR-M22]